jgi:hypothetical protein
MREAEARVKATSAFTRITSMRKSKGKRLVKQDTTNMLSHVTKIKSIKEK